MTNPSLTSLLAPRGLQDFFPHLRDGKAFVVEAVSGVEELTGLPFLQSFEALLQTWPFPVQAHLPKVADEASSIDVTTTDAKAVFENGMGLLFDHAERISCELQTWLEAIRIDLGFSNLTQSRCLIYATPDGKGTAPHFDQNANFVLQLHGTKKWWVAPNTTVKNVLSRHTLGLPMDTELETYVDKPMPVTMPADATEIILKPGSLLFVPNGMWHTTLAEGDALSLNFTYHAPTWLDLLTSALRSRLALDPEWRETAHAVSEAAAEEKLDALLTDLAAELPQWKASDILSATER